MAKKDQELAQQDAREKRLATLDYGDDASGGLQDRTADDMKISFLSLLQSLSPQLIDEQRKIKGAELGMFFDSVTEELWGEEIFFVPSLREICWVEWIKRDQGGGFVARYETDSQFIRDLGLGPNERLHELANGHDLVKTVYVWGIRVVPEEGKTYPLIVPFDRSKWKAYTPWRMKLDMTTLPESKQIPPMWAHYVRISSKQEKNKAGQPYQNYCIQPAINNDIHDSLLTPDDPRFIEARKIRGLVSSGALKAAEESRSSVGGDPEDSGDSPF